MATTKSEAPLKRPRNAGTSSLYSHPLPVTLAAPSLVSWVLHYAALLVSSSSSTPRAGRCRAVYDAATASIWVTDQPSVDVLWRRGFWGKGSLSRSEPTWHQRARNRRLVQLDQSQYRKGFVVYSNGVRKVDSGVVETLTAEEFTAKRRIERRELKVLKAKEKLVQSDDNTTPILKSGKKIRQPKTEAVEIPNELLVELETVENLEHLQLIKEETFFLLWGLDCLDLFIKEDEDESTTTTTTQMTYNQIGILSTWSLFTLPLQRDEQICSLRPDNSFIVSYSVYHHFRSLGWVVRSGIKFCCDFILYNQKGPVGSHAEFAVCIMPTYEDSNDEPKQKDDNDVDISQQRRTWRWFSTLNRVCSGVKKTLIFAYVVIPSRKRCSRIDLQSPACLSMYQVREVAIKRFIPSRMRD